MVAARARDAVTALAGVMSSDLSAALRAVETADGIDANSLGDAAAVVQAKYINDNRSLLVQVFAESVENVDDVRAGSAGGISSTECKIVFSYNSVDADQSLPEVFCWRWSDAICDVITADPTLDGNVVGARWLSIERTFEFVDESTTRHVRTITVEVKTC